MRNVENEQKRSYPINKSEKKGMVLKMQKKYKVGLIGLGGIAKGAHMSAYGRMDNVELAAICDILPIRS